VALVLALGGALIASRRVPGRVAFDTKLYHLPAIERFRAQWPAIDPWDYLSATTPGYHVLMASLAKVFGAADLLYQLATLSISAGLVWVVASMACADRQEPRSAADGPAGCAPALPFVCSMYVLLASVYALPDNAGWLGVAGMLALALRADRHRAWWLALGGVVLVWTVLMRQIHAWSAGLLWVAAWTSLPGDHDAGASAKGLVIGRAGERSRRAALAVVATLPGLVLLALFVRYWGGLVPPRFQEWYPPRPPTAALTSPAPVFFLTTLGAYGVFFFGYWWEGLRRLWRRRRGTLAGVAALAVALALVPATTFDYDAGRRTGLWELVPRFPVLLGRTSVVMLGGSLAGGLVLASLLVLQPARRGLVVLAGVAGFCLAQSFSKETWQRYNDPMVLMVLAVLCAAVPREPGGWCSRARALGPVVLSVLFLALCVRAYRGERVLVSDPPPPTRSPDHRGSIRPPMELPPIPKPAGKGFW
jgi:hypothetical protein